MNTKNSFIKDHNPFTEGVKYAGSKLKLIPHILSLISDLNINTVLDGFSGTTRVSQAFAKNGLKVFSNDISEWSYTFGNCYLLSKNSYSYYEDIIAHLNNLKGYHGWFSEHYGGYNFLGSSVQPSGKKMLWQMHNANKLDAIREEIDKLSLNEIDKSVILTSLILSLDEVDNTLGHFSSYLKEWSPRSFKTMEMKVPNLFNSEQEHKVIKDNIFNTIDNIEADLAYFDPPYGSNNEKMPPSRVRYSAYYHIWTTICKNDKPELFGVANRRKDTSDTIATSVFEEFKKDINDKFIAVNAIDKMISMVNSRYVMLSYSSGGKATANELNEILKKNGKLIKTIELDYKKNVMANMKWTNDWISDAEKPHREFIFLIDKSA